MCICETNQIWVQIDELIVLYLVYRKRRTKHVNLSQNYNKTDISFQVNKSGIVRKIENVKKGKNLLSIQKEVLYH